MSSHAITRPRYDQTRVTRTDLPVLAETRLTVAVRVARKHLSRIAQAATDRIRSIPANVVSATAFFTAATMMGTALAIMIGR